MTRVLSVVGLAVGIVVTTAVGSSVAAEGPSLRDLARRYGIWADLDRYPQDGPRQTVRSVIKATRSGDIEYLVAHLISPAQVDKRLGRDPQALRKLAAKATPAKSQKTCAALSRQLAEGRWTIRRNLAWVEVDGVPDVSLEKLGGRWFMHNTPVVPRRLPAALAPTPGGLSRWGGD